MFLLYAIPAGIALASAAYTCTKGVTVKEGTIPLRGDWRIKWACWRYVAEIRWDDEGSWMPAGKDPDGEKAAAGAIAKLLVGPGAEGITPSTSATDEPMIQVTHARAMK